ncbi:MAG: hypothetical protein IPK28_15270 [Devosia sp.]|nr:hypothetical protein [Devosia sp.]
MQTNLTNLATPDRYGAQGSPHADQWQRGRPVVADHGEVNLVAAINELQAAVASATEINDASTGTAATRSASKIITELNDVKSDILGAGAAFDTCRSSPR